MVASNKVWLNNSLPRVEDVDLNGFNNENKNLIAGSGQVPSDADNQQTHKAVAIYSAAGVVYEDIGVQNAVKLQPLGSRVSPGALITGMEVQFKPAFDNNGASTLQVEALAVTPLTVRELENSNTVATPDLWLRAGRLAVARYDSVLDEFVMETPKATTSTTDDSTLVLATAGAVSALRGDIESLANWTSPTQLGVTIDLAPFGAFGTPALAALNGTDIAFVDSQNDKLRTFRFDGNDWAELGTGLAIASVGDPTIAALNGTDIAFIDGTNDQLRTYSFDGSIWVQVGNSLPVTNTSPKMTALNGTDIAFTDTNTETLRTFRFTDPDWAQVGNSLPIAGMGFPGLVALNATDIAFIDGNNSDLRTYRFTDPDWAQVGNELSITAPSIGTSALAALNATDIALIGSGDDTLNTYRFDGVDWVRVGGGQVFVNIIVPAMVALNGTDVVLADGNVETVTAYRFGFSLGPLPHNRQLTG